MTNDGRRSPPKGSRDQYRINKNTNARSDQRNAGRSGPNPHHNRNSVLNLAATNASNRSTSDVASLFAAAARESNASVRDSRKPKPNPHPKKSTPQQPKFFWFADFMQQWNDYESQRKNSNQQSLKSTDKMEVDTGPNPTVERLRQLRMKIREVDRGDLFGPGTPDYVLEFRQSASLQQSQKPAPSQNDQPQVGAASSGGPIPLGPVQPQLPTGFHPTIPATPAPSQLPPVPPNQVSAIAKRLASSAQLPEIGTDRFSFLKDVLETNGLPSSRRKTIENLLLKVILSALETVFVKGDASRAKLDIIDGGAALLSPFLGSKNVTWNEIRRTTEPIWQEANKFVAERKPFPRNIRFEAVNSCIRESLRAMQNGNLHSLSDPRGSIENFDHVAARVGLIHYQGQAVDSDKAFKVRAEHGARTLETSIQRLLQHSNLNESVQQQSPQTAEIRKLAELARSLIATIPCASECLKRISCCYISEAVGTVALAKPKNERQATSLRQKQYELYSVAIVMAQVVADAVFSYFVVHSLRNFKRHYLPSFAFFNGDAKDWWRVVEPLHSSLLDIFAITIEDVRASLPTGVELESFLSSNTGMRGSSQDLGASAEVNDTNDQAQSSEETLPPDWMDDAFKHLYEDAALSHTEEEILDAAVYTKFPDEIKKGKAPNAKKEDAPKAKDGNAGGVDELIHYSSDEDLN